MLPKFGEATKSQAILHHMKKRNSSITVKDFKKLPCDLSTLLVCLLQLTSSSHVKLPLAYLPLELRALAAGPKDHVLAILRAFTRTL